MLLASMVDGRICRWYIALLSVEICFPDIPFLSWLIKKTNKGKVKECPFRIPTPTKSWCCCLFTEFNLNLIALSHRANTFYMAGPEISRDFDYKHTRTQTQAQTHPSGIIFKIPQLTWPIIAPKDLIFECHRTWITLTHTHTHNRIGSQTSYFYLNIYLSVLVNDRSQKAKLGSKLFQFYCVHKLLFHFKKNFFFSSVWAITSPGEPGTPLWEPLIEIHVNLMKKKQNLTKGAG